MRKQVALVGAALLLTATAASEASAAPCAPTTTYTGFTPCSVRNVFFNRISVGGLFAPLAFELVESITPYDDGTYAGLSFQYHSSLPDIIFQNTIVSSYSVGPLEGYELTGIRIASDTIFDAQLSPGAGLITFGGTSTFQFDDLPIYMQGFFRDGVHLQGWHGASAPITSTVAFSVAPLSPVPLPGAAILMGTALLGFAGFGAWHKRQRMLP